VLPVLLPGALAVDGGDGLGLRQKAAQFGLKVKSFTEPLRRYMYSHKT
jgi:hypothetical protein